MFSPFGWPKLAFSWVASLFVAFLSAVEAGATFVFGTLALSPGAEGSLGFFFFAYVLPTVIVFASLMSILYYLGIMQKVVQGVAWVVQRALGTSGPESLSVSANIFVGQTEAPLVIKPYVKNLTRSELMAVMTGGMATIAGGVLASYVAFLGERYAAVARDRRRGRAADLRRATAGRQRDGRAPRPGLGQDPDPRKGYLASTWRARLATSRRWSRRSRPPVTGRRSQRRRSPRPRVTRRPLPPSRTWTDAGPKNVIDAAATGAADGMQLALNIGAMLIAFLAIIAILNQIIDGTARAVRLHCRQLELIRAGHDPRNRSHGLSACQLPTPRHSAAS